VVRLPGGTARALDAKSFGVAVMGKTGTSSEFKDALFVGSTFGPRGITVAVWIGFDDAGPLGEKESGAKAALPVFRELVGRIYQQGLLGPAPRFPSTLEHGIDTFLLPPPPPLDETVLAGASVTAAEAILTSADPVTAADLVTPADQATPAGQATPAPAN
jgi:penicillin-binding protein 1A